MIDMSDARVKYYEFYGGTPFVIAANSLGYLEYVGDWLTPGCAVVPVEEATAYFDLLVEIGVKFTVQKRYF